jgi:hypothetical protein
MGLTDLHFQTATIDRFPRLDHKEMALPTAELPMFAFPHQLSLTRGSISQFPLPVFFTFVFTDEKGAHLYVACLRFFESVDLDDARRILASIHSPDTVSALQRPPSLNGALLVFSIVHSCTRQCR